MDKPYEILCSADDPEWLDRRREMITASEMACILPGKSFKSREDILREKVTGESNFKENAKMWWGKKMEDPNMDAFAEIVDAVVLPSQRLLRSRVCPLIGATLDGKMEAPQSPGGHVALTKGLYSYLLEAALVDGTGLIEMKNSDGWNKRKWEEKYPERCYPDYYWTQVQVQLFVSGLTWGTLCVKFGASDMSAWIIYPDENFHQKMIAEAESFWQDVKDAKELWNG